MALERVAQDLLATERREQLALGRREVDVRRRDVDAGALGREDDVGERRAAVGEDVGHRALDGVEVDAEAGREIRLRVHVDAEDAIALLRERAGEVDRRRRLADAALLVRDRDHVRHRGITSNRCDADSRRVTADGGRSRHATPAMRVADRRGYPHSSRVVHRFLWICRHRTGLGDRPDALGLASRHYHGGCPCAKTIDGACTVPTNEERIARLDAMRAESRLGGGQDRDRPAARPRQADRARAARAAARRRTRSSSSTRSSRTAIVRRSRRRVPRRRRRHRPRHDRRPDWSSSSARTSRSSADRCPRRTPRRSARSWTSR